MPQDNFSCTIDLHFDPWGYADDAELEVLLPLPSSDGYQHVLAVTAPDGLDIVDASGRRRLVRLEQGQTATVTVRVATQRLRHGQYLQLPPPGPADLAAAPMIVADEALRDLALRCITGIDSPRDRIAALAKATADALRYQYPRDGRGAARSLARGWGDCGEYAFVFTALCRLADIPARPVFGLLAAPWMTSPHAWAEAWDATGWLPVDPNFVREGVYLGPLFDTGAQPQDHIGALDMYRLVLSRHTGIPWPGAVPDIQPAQAAGFMLDLDGIGPVAFWHAAPAWQARPVVPFLQMPWTVIAKPRPASLRSTWRRLRPWRVKLRAPSRRWPRSPWVVADIVAMHPAKGIAFVIAAVALMAWVPPLSAVLQAAVWLWVAVFGLGMLRYARLMRLRSKRRAGRAASP